MKNKNIIIKLGQNNLINYFQHIKYWKFRNDDGKMVKDTLASNYVTLKDKLGHQYTLEYLLTWNNVYFQNKKELYTMNFEKLKDLAISNDFEFYIFEEGMSWIDKVYVYKYLQNLYSKEGIELKLIPLEDCFFWWCSDKLEITIELRSKPTK